MLFTLFALALLLLAALPTALVIRNLAFFERARVASESGTHAQHVSVSVLIPARNEQAGIGDALTSVTGSSWKSLEVIVLDDHSTDRTAEIVQQLSLEDARIRLASAPDLPEDWNGKQHACWQAAHLARGELLLFMDADVRLSKDAIERLMAEFERRHAKLLSGFPSQEQGSLSEMLLIPLMYVVLLGYLPLEQMRASCKPAFGAGCGQLFLADRNAYFESGGHQAIASSRHDGLKLPRAFRAAGHMTDLMDASDLATVRMYRGWREVVRGLLKNATEGIASGNLIVLFSVLLLGAFTAPLFSFAHALFYQWPALPTILLGMATGLSFIPRALIAMRLGHPMVGALLNPIAVLIFVALQWVAFTRQTLGLGTVQWRGRS